MTDLEDILNEFMGEPDLPAYPVVLDWVRRYPQYARELTDFAVALAQQRALPEPEPLAKADLAALVERGMAVVRGILDGEMGQPEYTGQRVSVPGVWADGNAAFIISKVRRELRRAGLPRETIDAYTRRATAGNYDNLLRVTMEYVSDGDDEEEA